MKKMLEFFAERPVRTIVGLALIVAGLLLGINGVGGLALSTIGAIVLTD